MELTFALENINIADISSKCSFENIVQEYTRIPNHAWYKFSKNVNITKHLKVWWNNEYSTKLNTYPLIQITKELKEVQEICQAN